MAKWDSYCLAEDDRIRWVLLDELDQFISLLIKTDSKEYEEWGYELSAKVVDQEIEFPIRMPLFEKVLFPMLLSGCNNQVAGCARWLSGFSQLIYKSKAAKDAIGTEFNEISFLKLALNHDPGDLLSKKRLVIALAWQLDFAIHEVPTGVLYGNNGASIEQCEELKSELSEFETLVDEIGESKNYFELITDCKLHFSEYPKYLSKMQTYTSYDEYLSVKHL